MLDKAIAEYGIYSDEKLRTYISDLEKRFDVKDERDFFGKLVNFYTNVKVPYHGWFKYREGFSHALVEELIKRSGVSRDEYVLDPFCGSGTTVVEAALNGYCGVGMDINPVAAFLSKVKCRSYSDGEVRALRRQAEELSERIRARRVNQDSCGKYEEVRKFFNENNYKNLLAVKACVDDLKERDSKVYEFFLCAYICIIEAVSDRKRDGNGLKTMLSKVTDVASFFDAQVQSMLRDIEEYRIKPEVMSVVSEGDAMELSVIAGKAGDMMHKNVGMIMYSPPYANSFDYFESYKLEVILADYAHDMKSMNIYRRQAVESFIGRTDVRNTPRQYVCWMADEIERAVPAKEAATKKRDSRTRKVPKMLKGYFADMERVIAESAKALERGKKCYIVVDQSAYLGRIVPTDLFLAAIAENYKFHVNEIIICRNAKTSGQQIQKYPYLSGSLRESIVVLEKE